MAEGNSNTAIGDELAVVAKTVESHIANIFTKPGLFLEETQYRRVLAVLTYLRS